MSENKKGLKTNKRNKIYHIWVDDCYYEEYDAFIVIAKSFNEAKRLIFSEYGDTVWSWKERKIFKKIIGETYLEKQGVLGSFNKA